jgi:hypothetical protein
MPERPAHIPRYTLALLTGAVACLVLALAWPRLQASVRFLPVDTALAKYRESRTIDSAQLDALAERAERAIAAHDHYRYYEGLSELRLLAGNDMQRPYWQRRGQLEQSLSAAEEVVGRAPARPRAWLRIGRIRAALGQPPETVVAAWKLSVLTGRVEPRLMPVRLELGFRYLGALDGEARALLRDQLVLGWSIQQRQVLALIEEGTLAPAAVRELLSGTHPAILAGMEGL